MAIKILKPNQKIDLVAINEFEAFIGEKLPEDYQKFLLAFNGGKPESNVLSIPEIMNSVGVNRFYGLLDGRQPGDLLYEQEPMLDHVPEKILVISNAEGGNCVCLSLRPDKTFGQVSFWDHELEAEEGETATFSNLFRIGNSFADFFESLKSFDISQIKLKPGKVKKAWINPCFLKE